MIRAVKSSILSLRGQAMGGRTMVLMALFVMILGMGLLQPAPAEAEQLVVGPTTTLATSPKNAAAAYVVLSRMTLTHTGSGDGLVTLASATLTTGQTATISALRVYLSTKATTTLPSDARQLGRTSGLITAGTTTSILFSGVTTSKRSVFNGGAYLYIVADMLYTQFTRTAQVQVTAINVESPDTNTAGPFAISNAILLNQPSYLTATINDCTGCHGTTKLDNTIRSSATGSFRGSHNMHVDTKTIPCSGCHVYPTANDHRDDHISMASTFSFQGAAANYYSKTVGTTLYRFPQSANPGFGTCSALYCHSNGAGAPAEATWAGTLPTDCTGCHGNNVTSAASISTNAHDRHISSTAVGWSITCDRCHSATVSADRTISTQTSHVNNTINVRFNNNIVLDSDGPTYNGNPATLATPGGSQKAPLSGVGACNNVYCHSSGNLYNISSGTSTLAGGGTPTFKPVTWSGAIGCDGCHGNAAGKAHPTYTSGGTGTVTSNSHVEHVEGSGLGCTYCHDKTTTGTGTAAASLALLTGGTTSHLNRKEDVSFALNGGLTGLYNADKSCSSTYCHGTTSPSPSWGGTTQCNSCHEASNALSSGQANTNRHSMHYETSTVATTIITGTSSTAGSYVFNCGNCHNRPDISHATGANDVKFNISFGSTPTAGLYTVGANTALDSRNRQYSYNGTCQTIYCHSSGQPLNGVISYKTVTWNQAQGSGVNQCSVCHNGLAASAAPIASNKHTFHISTTTYNIPCGECHYGTVGSGTSIVDKTLHVNGTNNVAWGPRSTGGDNYSSPNCGGGANGLYCHSRGTSNSAPYPASLVSVTWSNGQTLTCAGCHGNTSSGSTSLNTGAHAKHLNTSTWLTGQIYCDDCHNLTAASSTNASLNAATGYANHVNKFVTIALNNTSGGAGATYGGSTVGGGTGTQKVPGQTTQASCSTTNCHGGNSQSWSVVNQDATCVKCHGVAGTSTPSFNADLLRAAPGYVVTAGSNTGVNTSGSFTFTDSRVGTHDAHLRGTNGYKPGGVGCDDCHAVTSLTSSGHMNGQTSFVWSNTVRNIGTQPYAASYGMITPQYGVAGTGACSTNYCHGGGFGGVAGLVGTDPTPTWNDAGYLPVPASAMDQTSCNRCHMSPPTYTGRYDHSSVTFGAGACNACHQHDGSGLSHIDGVLYGQGTCDSCHSYDVDANNDWGYSPRAVEGWGAHALHIKHLKTVNSVTLSAGTNTFGGPIYAQVCGVCHSNTSDSNIHSMGGVTNVRSIVFGGTLAYQFSTLSGSPTYNGVTGTSSFFAKKSCSNVSCHFQESPIWQGY